MGRNTVVLAQNRLRHINHRRDEDNQYTNQGGKGRCEFEKTRHVPRIVANFSATATSIRFIYTSNTESRRSVSFDLAHFGGLNKMGTPFWPAVGRGGIDNRSHPRTS